MASAYFFELNHENHKFKVEIEADDQEFAEDYFHQCSTVNEDGIIKVAGPASNFAILKNVEYADKLNSESDLDDDIMKKDEDNECQEVCCSIIGKEKGCGDSNPRFKWNSSATKLLIALRKDCQLKFEAPVCKKNKLWMDISRKMKNLGNYKVSGNECYDKFRNLSVTYRRNHEKKISTNESTCWEYYDQMDEVFNKKVLKEPSSPLITESPTSKVLTSSTTTTTNTNSSDFKKRFLENMEAMKHIEERKAVALENLVELLRKNQESLIG